MPVRVRDVGRVRVDVVGGRSLRRETGSGDVCSGIDDGDSDGSGAAQRRFGHAVETRGGVLPVEPGGRCRGAGAARSTTFRSRGARNGGPRRNRNHNRSEARNCRSCSAHRRHMPRSDCSRARIDRNPLDGRLCAACVVSCHEDGAACDQSEGRNVCSIVPWSPSHPSLAEISFIVPASCPGAGGAGRRRRSRGWPLRRIAPRASAR